MSVTISELIGFPVSKEHGDELLKRMSAYNQMTKKELISLLLQYDWELLQTQQAMPEKITKNTMTEYLSEVGSRIQSAIEATHAANVIAEMKREPFDMWGDEKKSIFPGVPVESPVVVDVCPENAQKNSHQVIFSGARSHGKSYAVIFNMCKRVFIEKAVEWFRHQKEEIGISWFDDYEIRFREAMEEL